MRIESATPPAGKVHFKSYFKLSTNCTFVVIRQVKIMIKIPIISNVDLSAMNGGSKAWDGCLQARAINVLHPIMFLGFWLLLSLFSL